MVAFLRGKYDDPYKSNSVYVSEYNKFSNTTPSILLHFCYCYKYCHITGLMHEMRSKFSWYFIKHLQISKINI